MKHASTRTVFAYWEEKRGARLAPERGDIDPVAIRHALGDTFMLAADFVEELRFRLAGTRVCALFCREIKGESFSNLWSEESRKSIADLVTIVTGESIGAVAGVTGHAEDGVTVDLELLLLPLAYIGQARIRALGVLAPLAPPYWIGEKPIAELELGTLRHLGAEIEHFAPHVAPTTQATTVRHGFTVYSGGRADP
jgi:hypothetical protein